MRTGFDLLRRLDGFLETLDFVKHLLETLLVSVLLGNRKLLDDLVAKIFDFRFEDRNEVFHGITWIYQKMGSSRVLVEPRP